MDINLFKEITGFKKRFFDNVNEKSVKNMKSKRQEADAIVSPSRPLMTHSFSFEGYGARDLSKKQFTVLARIVLHMRNRHLRGDSFPLSLNEILEETKLQTTGNIIKWLQNDALPNNPKIKYCENENKFKFKPPYKIRDGRCLLRLLKRHDLKSLGGIALEDVDESMPNSGKVLQRYKDDILVIERPRDKKQVLFYNDRSLTMTVSDSVKKLWRSIAVSDDNHVQMHLEREGIHSIEGVVKKFPQKRASRASKTSNSKSKKPRDNTHCADVLQHYEAHFDQK